MLEFYQNSVCARQGIQMGTACNFFFLFLVIAASTQVISGAAHGKALMCYFGSWSTYRWSTGIRVDSLLIFSKNSMHFTNIFSRSISNPNFGGFVEIAYK